MATYTMKDFINENIAVRVGQKHAKEFLEMCEKHKLHWPSRDSATEFVPDEYEDKLSIAFNRCHDGRLGFCWDGWYTDDGWEVVDFKDLVVTPRYQIILECDGDVTTAKMTINGKETKVATAKRNPEDKFDWKTGASVAFERLWEKASKKNEVEKNDETKKKFEVGDRVVCIGKTDGNQKIVNCHGTVICDAERSRIGVEFDKHVDGHTCFGSGKDNYCWFCDRDTLRHETSAPKTVKEVKRQANTGEYIKLVNKVYSFDRVGDILKVHENWYNTGVHVLESSRPTPSGSSDDDKNFPWHYANDDYVVLEGYEPPKTEVKKVKRLAKKGEYIKVVDAWMTNNLYENGDIIEVKEFYKDPSEGKVRVRNPRDPSRFIHILPREYVVLEGYEPGMEV